jgi:uncharacterized protein involved in type VI secretion and phage assembly
MSEDVLARILAPQSYQSREQRVFGIVTAKVDRVGDDGTCRLKFHGMNGQDDDDVSAPARVASPMASSQYGAYFFPEQGDEVVVAFHAGDTNLPIILGSVYNSDNQPPNQANQSSSNNCRTIVSRSGHQLTFDDTSGSQKVTIQTQGGHSIVLDDTSGQMKITITSAGGRSITVDDAAPGQVQIQTSTCQLTMSDGGGTMTLQATASLTLSAPSISLSGTTITIGSGPGTTSVDGSSFSLHTHSDGNMGAPTGGVIP